MSHFPGFALTGKVMLVTGAGRGIGRAIALCAAEQGADLALGSRTLSELEEVGAVLFLDSDAATMVTGHTLAVDEGWTAV